MPFRLFHRFPSKTGFSLIELLFALVIISTVLAISVPRIQDGLELQLKSSTRKLSSTIRYAYDESVVKRKYYRIAFSLPSDKDHSFWVEYTEQPYFIRTAEKQEKYKRELEQLNEEKRKEILEKEAKFTRIEDHLTKEIKLPSGIRFADIYIDHQSGKIESGQTHLHFFPNGMTQKAIINLEDEDGNVYSLDVYPLTGKAKIRREYLDYEAL